MKTMLKSLTAAVALSVAADAAMAQEEVVVYHWFEYLFHSHLIGQVYCRNRYQSNHGYF